MQRRLSSTRGPSTRRGHNRRHCDIQCRLLFQKICLFDVMESTNASLELFKVIRNDSFFKRSINLAPVQILLPVSFVNPTPARCFHCLDKPMSNWGQLQNCFVALTLSQRCINLASCPPACLSTWPQSQKAQKRSIHKHLTLLHESCHTLATTTSNRTRATLFFDFRLQSCTDMCRYHIFIPNSQHLINVCPCSPSKHRIALTRWHTASQAKAHVCTGLVTTTCTDDLHEPTLLLCLHGHASQQSLTHGQISV